MEIFSFFLKLIERFVNEWSFYLKMSKSEKLTFMVADAKFIRKLHEK